MAEGEWVAASGPAQRSVVITGASRGLGLASAVHLYERGWQVVAAMRSPGAGLERIRELTGASADDPRLVGVRLDLTDPESITSAAKAIEEAVGAPDALVHNAGITAAGCVEEMELEVWEQLFTTNLFGPVALTRALLPAMRARGSGRIVVVASESGVRGMPITAAYSAVKGASERWAESLANEIAPFGLGVSVLVTGTFDTEMITDAGAQDLRDFDGPYGSMHTTIDRRGRLAIRIAAKPSRFARGLARALEDRGPFARHAVGPDAHALLAMNRLLPSRLLHHVIRVAMGIPRQGTLRPSTNPLPDRRTSP